MPPEWRNCHTQESNSAGPWHRGGSSPPPAFLTAATAPSEFIVDRPPALLLSSFRPAAEFGCLVTVAFGTISETRFVHEFILKHSAAEVVFRFEIEIHAAILQK